MKYPCDGRGGSGEGSLDWEEVVGEGGEEDEQDGDEVEAAHLLVYGEVVEGLADD